MQTLMETRFHGAQQLIVVTCFSSKNKIKSDFNVSNAKNSTVLIAEWNGIKIWHANNIKFLRQRAMTIWSSWSLSKVKNLNNAQSANFGYRKMKDATIWLVNANFSSATNVEEFTWSASVFRKRNNKWKEDKGWHSKDVERSSKEHRNLAIKSLRNQ